MNFENIKNYICIFGGYDEDDIADYLPIVENVCERIKSQLCTSCNVDDPSVSARLNFLAACRAYYEINLTASGAAGSVTSFTAGDISLTENSQVASKAKELLENAENMCNGLMTDGAFAFMEV